jgi:tetratricopeptide (TPR) repeat protein
MEGSRVTAVCLIGAALLAAQTGCERAGSKGALPAEAPNPIQSAAPDARRIVLAPLGGDTALDQEIARAQEQARTAGDSFAALEKLGWLFVARARVSFDPGFYKLAEQCGLAMGSQRPHSPEALLLRGHALQNLHHFKDAEPLARELVARRGRAFDYGLLGDVLMEQGRLDEAVAVYQQMADIKPDLHAYTRAAHMRFLKGDLAGAMEMMQLAVQAASPRDAESAAWVYSRMALYQLQSDDLTQSLRYSDAALQFESNYPPALLVRGKVLLAQGKNSDAADALSVAESANPLPEYQWALAEALRAANRAPEAVQVERLLTERGAASDPRTFALYLASSGGDASSSVRLATAELKTRGDVFTYDALAWSLAAAGRWSEASTNMQRALAEGTQDARLFFHAGIIAAKTAQTSEAEKFLRQAAAIEQMLLPSERAQLLDCAGLLGINFSTPAPAVKKDLPEQRVLLKEEKQPTKPNQTERS